MRTMRLIYDICEICGEPFKIKDDIPMSNGNSKRCLKCRLNILVAGIFRYRDEQERKRIMNKIYGERYYEI